MYGYLFTFLVLFVSVRDVLGSHFYGGTINWRLQPGTTDTVIVTFETTWDSGPLFEEILLDGVGQADLDGECLGTFDDDTGCSLDTSSDIFGKVLASGTDILGNTWETLRHVEVFTIADTSVEHKVELDEFARIGGLQVGGGDYRIFTTINLQSASNGGSPKSALPHIVQFPIGVPHSIDLTPLDADGSSVTCRKATFAESGLSSNTHYSVSANCIVTMTVPGTAGQGDQWPQNIVMETSDGDESSVDFIIEAVDWTTGYYPPIATPTPSGHITVCVFSPVTVYIDVTDPDGGFVTPIVIFAPFGSTFSPTIATAVPFTATFTWTPTSTGFFFLVVIFKDSTGLFDFVIITFCVIYCPIVGGGDPEYDSLDALDFTYDGPCQYLLSTNECTMMMKDIDLTDMVDGSPYFEVLTRHGRSRNREKQVVSIAGISITVNTTNIFISKGNIVTTSTEITDDDSGEGITISKENYLNKKGDEEELIKVSTDFGLVISVNLQNIGTVWMHVPESIQTCGLLGNNNGDMKDDLQLKNGTILSDVKNQYYINLMGDSWMVPYKQQPLQCILHPLDSEVTSKDCYLFDYLKVKKFCNTMIDINLKSMTGKDIELCFANRNETYVDPTRIFDDCITEVCNCKSSNRFDCYPKYALYEWMEACKTAGVSFIPVDVSYMLPYN